MVNKDEYIKTTINWSTEIVLLMFVVKSAAATAILIFEHLSCSSIAQCYFRLVHYKIEWRRWRDS